MRNESLSSSQIDDLMSRRRCARPRPEFHFNECYALFVIDHGKKHMTFTDFTPSQDWCKHMPNKKFVEAIIMASKKYKIAYSKKRSEWVEDIFKWEHTIRNGLPIDLKGYFLRTTYLLSNIEFFYDNHCI
jgi:hypothetical protein